MSENQLVRAENGEHIGLDVAWRLVCTRCHKKLKWQKAAKPVVNVDGVATGREANCCGNHYLLFPHTFIFEWIPGPLLQEDMDKGPAPEAGLDVSPPKKRKSKETIPLNPLAASESIPTEGWVGPG